MTETVSTDDAAVGGGAAAPRAVELRVDDTGRLRAQQLLASLAPGTKVRIAVIADGEAEGDGAQPRLSGHHNLVLGIVGACALVVAVLAIAGTHWPWTGFRGNGTLWSWLKLLVAPAALASLPIRLASAGRRIGSWLGYGWAALAVALAVTVLGGYELGWTWTGYRGKTLWDWFNLLLFPLVLVLLPDWVERGTALGRRGALLGVALLTVLTLLIVGGYHMGWSWTGFTGNTFRDWLDLLIAPFLLPTACRWFNMYWQARARARAGGGAAGA